MASDSSHFLGSPALGYAVVTLAVLLGLIWTVFPILLLVQMRRLRKEMERLNATVESVKQDTTGVFQIVENTAPLKTLPRPADSAPLGARVPVTRLNPSLTEDAAKPTETAPAVETRLPSRQTAESSRVLGGLTPLS